MPGAGKKKPQPYHGALLLVVWEDVFSDTSWIEPGAMAEWEREPFLVTEVGFLVERTSKHIVISSQRVMEGKKPSNWGNRTKIPRSLIRAVRQVQR